MGKSNNNLKIFTNGILNENPVLRLMLGTCPTLAVSTAASNGIGMGLAATVVLVCSNSAISLLRKFIPEKVRIPVFITIIAGFVTIVQMLVKAFLPDIDKSLGIYLPLIVVNCIILARAEMFACKNSLVPSILDGLGMGIGFTATLTLMGIIRELIGAGTVFGITVTANIISPMLIMLLPPGGFFVFGVLIALSNAISRKTGKEVNTSDCASCPMADVCHQANIGSDISETELLTEKEEEIKEQTKEAQNNE